MMNLWDFKFAHVEESFLNITCFSRKWQLRIFLFMGYNSIWVTKLFSSEDDMVYYSLKNSQDSDITDRYFSEPLKMTHISCFGVWAIFKRQNHWLASAINWRYCFLANFGWYISMYDKSIWDHLCQNLQNNFFKSDKNAQICVLCNFHT